LYDFYGTFNFTILNQIEAGSRFMQQLDAVLQYRRQADQDQMAKRLKRCHIFGVVVFLFFIFNTQIWHDEPAGNPTGG